MSDQPEILPVDRLLAELKFSSDGLITAIAQDAESKEILMVAWMNREAVIETLQTGKACYWSRSRGRLWRKGEESGQFQTVREVRLDCDGDTLLLIVDQIGVACHTGRRSCFFRRADGSGWISFTNPLVDPELLYRKQEK